MEGGGGGEELYSTSFLLSMNEMKAEFSASKKEIVRRATCKFVRKFRPPLPF